MQVDFRCHRARAGVARKEPGMRLTALPIAPDARQEFGRECHKPVVPAFALPNAEHPAGTVDIRDLQLTEFGDAEAGRIECGEEGAVLQVMPRTQQCGDFRLAQNGGQGEGAPGMGNTLRHQDCWRVTRYKKHRVQTVCTTYPKLLRKIHN